MMGTLIPNVREWIVGFGYSEIRSRATLVMVIVVLNVARCGKREMFLRELYDMSDGAD